MRYLQSKLQRVRIYSIVDLPGHFCDLSIFIVALGLEHHDRPWHISSTNALTGEGKNGQWLHWVVLILM